MSQKCELANDREYRNCNVLDGGKMYVIALEIVSNNYCNIKRRTVTLKYETFSFKPNLIIVANVSQKRIQV